MFNTVLPYHYTTNNDYACNNICSAWFLDVRISSCSQTKAHAELWNFPYCSLQIFAVAFHELIITCVNKLIFLRIYKAANIIPCIIIIYSLMIQY